MVKHTSEVIRDGASCTGKRGRGRNGKESAMAFVREPSQHSPGVIQENHSKPKSGWPDQESNLGPPECKSIELPLHHLARVTPQQGFLAEVRKMSGYGFQFFVMVWRLVEGASQGFHLRPSDGMELRLLVLHQGEQGFDSRRGRPLGLSQRVGIVPDDVLHQGEQGFDSRRGRPLGLSQRVGIVPDDATGRRVFVGDLPFPPVLYSSASPYSHRFTSIGSQVLCYTIIIYIHFVLPTILLAFHLGELGSTPGDVVPKFSHVGIVLYDAAGRRSFSVISRFPHSSFQRCSIFTTVLYTVACGEALQDKLVLVQYCTHSAHAAETSDQSGTRRTWTYCDHSLEVSEAPITHTKRTEQNRARTQYKDLLKWHKVHTTAQYNRLREANNRLARKHLANPITARCGATANEHTAEAPLATGEVRVGVATRLAFPARPDRTRCCSLPGSTQHLSGKFPNKPLRFPGVPPPLPFTPNPWQSSHRYWRGNTLEEAWDCAESSSLPLHFLLTARSPAASRYYETIGENEGLDGPHSSHWWARTVDAIFLKSRMSDEIWPALAIKPIRVIEVYMEWCRNERVREMGDLRENPPNNSIVRHDCHVLKSCDPAGH
ncbi:hypothetical protein PR048_008021 [Dryococelus australis]|uniref:Uncharacterized protein n=1 Tax=Dryococelus australis TaxID=614101 RepID=A0ABQ9HW25_9NEOP|nr:hypothetical protein PR048_008021 [Dryococelus australis]